MLKKILGAILATSMLFSTNVLAEEFSTQPMIYIRQHLEFGVKK